MERINLLLDKYSCEDHRAARELVDNPVVSNLLDEVIALKCKNERLQVLLDDIVDQYTNDVDRLASTLESLSDPDNVSDSDQES